MKYSLLTGKGFGAGAGWFGSSTLIKARLAMVILFFLNAILSKWLFSMAGISFNLITAEAGGILFYILLISLTGSVKLCLGLAIVVSIVCGLLGGAAFGSTDDND